MPWPAELAHRTAPARWPELLRPWALRRPVPPNPADPVDPVVPHGGATWTGRPGGRQAKRPVARHLRALVSCDAVSEELPLVVDGTRRPSDAMAEHLQACLTCQAELAGYRRLLRVLRALRNDTVALPLDAQGAMRALQDRLSMRSRSAPHFPEPQKWTGPWLTAGAWAALGLVAFSTGALMARAGVPHAHH